MARIGRPTSLTEGVKAIILDAIRGGNYKSTACALAGINVRTLQDWERRAENGDEPYTSFVDELREAEAHAESQLVDEVRKAMTENGAGAVNVPWQSRAWMLERRWPQRWSGRGRVTAEAQIGLLTLKLRERLDDATFTRVVDAIEQAREEAASEEELAVARR